MRKDLTIPPCNYCGGPTYPVGKKKLESTAHFFCCVPCEEKWPIYESILSKMHFIKDFATRESTRRKTKLAIDMQHTAEKILKEDTVILFSDSIYSFKLSNESKSIYSDLLGKKAKSDLNEVRKTLDAIMDGKEVILKGS